MAKEHKFKSAQFQWWQYHKDYYKKLTQEQIEYIEKFENEYFNGSFKDYKKFNNIKGKKVLQKHIPCVFDNSIDFKFNYVHNILKDSSEWNNCKRKFIKQCKFDYIYDFGLQYFKRKCWNRKHKERDDVYAQSINDFFHISYEERQERGKDSKDSVRTVEEMMISLDDYFDQFQVGLVDAIKNNNVTDYLIYYMKFCLDTEEQYTLMGTLLEIEKFYQNKKLSKTKTLHYINMLNLLINEFTQKDEIKKLTNNIKLTFENYIYSNKNLYIKDLIR